MGDGKNQQCRVCGCTDDDCRQCIERTGEPCYWVQKNLCSACEDSIPNEKAYEVWLSEAEEKAIDSLGRYKFQMFGYWASIWVHINRISGLNKANPFGSLVKLARELKVEGD